MSCVSFHVVFWIPFLEKSARKKNRTPHFPFEVDITTFIQLRKLEKHNKMAQNVFLNFFYFFLFLYRSELDLPVLRYYCDSENNSKRQYLDSK